MYRQLILYKNIIYIYIKHKKKVKRDLCPLTLLYNKEKNLVQVFLMLWKVLLNLMIKCTLIFIKISTQCKHEHSAMKQSKGKKTGNQTVQFLFWVTNNSFEFQQWWRNVSEHVRKAWVLSQLEENNLHKPVLTSLITDTLVCNLVLLLAMQLQTIQ